MELTAVYIQVPEGYIGFVEELPGANTQGETLEETRANLKEAVQLVLEANRESAERKLTDYVKVAREPLRFLERFDVKTDVEDINQSGESEMNDSPETPMENLLFVPVQPKSERRVKFHVRVRSKWTFNPNLLDDGE
ncbi:MAG: type II toxin-antitoxin system HicB family antitoxin [Planctomycetaceae bacterium]